MTTPSISLPQIECPDVLLPTPANLRNLFGGLATHAYRYEIDELKKTLEDTRKLISSVDPKFEKIEIPELEWEIMITKLSADFPMYVQKQILELINTLFPIDFNVTILGIQINIIDFLTDPSTVLDNLKLEEIDSIYDLIPSEYKIWDKFETADFKKETVSNYIRSEVAKKMNLLLHGGFTGLIDLFDEIWDALGLPSLPALKTLDLEALIRDKTIEELKAVQIFGFSLLDLLGGEFDDNVEIPEFQKERLLKRAREFKEEWQTYLVKIWMEKVEDFFSAIGLDSIMQWITFSFCDYLKVIGFPSTINLPNSIQTLINTSANVLPNTTTGLDEDGIPIPAGT